MIITDKDFDLLYEYTPYSGFKLPVARPTSIKDHITNLRAEKTFLKKQMGQKGSDKTQISKQLKLLNRRLEIVKKTAKEELAKKAKRAHLTSHEGGVKGPVKPKPKPKPKFSPKKTVKDIGGSIKKGLKGRGRPIFATAVVALMIISLTHDWYEKRMDVAKRKCMNAPNKDECLQMYRKLAYVSRVKDLQTKKKYCNRANNPKKCIETVDQKISKIQARIKRG